MTFLKFLLCIQATISDLRQVTAWFDPNEVDPGGYTLLKWTSENADSCYSPNLANLSGTSGELGGLGNFQLSFISVKVICSGQGGSDSATARLKVRNPEVVSIANVSAPQTGKEVNVTWQANYVDRCSLNNNTVYMSYREGDSGQARIFARAGDRLYLNCYGRNNLTTRNEIDVQNDYSSSIQ